MEMVVASINMNIIIDKQRDRLLICDICNKRIIQWSRQRTISNTKSYGLALDNEGHLYVSDTYNHRIQKFHVDFSSNS